MTEQTKEEIKKEGIDLETVTFDANGAVEGLDDTELDDVAGAGNGKCANGVCATSSM
jgi:hypothetical protein